MSSWRWYVMCVFHRACKVGVNHAEYNQFVTDLLWYDVNYICIRGVTTFVSTFKSDRTPSFKPAINNGYKTIADTFMSRLKSVTNTFMTWLMAIKQPLNFQLRHNAQKRSTDPRTEPGFIPGGSKLKTKKIFMKIKTNIYFIFNKILHTK